MQQAQTVVSVAKQAGGAFIVGAAGGAGVVVGIGLGSVILGNIAKKKLGKFMEDFRKGFNQ